jgi:starch synthase (maltosyl-transferring)
MDTNYPAGTPRQGYPIEIQALWWAALDYLGRTDVHSGGKMANVGRTGATSFHCGTCFSTTMGKAICPIACMQKPGHPAGRQWPTTPCDPTSFLPLRWGRMTDKAVVAENVLFACQELLVPGAIRSLADRPVDPPLPVYHNGVLVNDPKRTVHGRLCAETRILSRKPAYHNGTAWTWVFPSFCEAWADCYGPEVKTGAGLAGKQQPLIDDGCVGHMPEILDGDAPHKSLRDVMPRRGG